MNSALRARLAHIKKKTKKGKIIGKNTRALAKRMKNF